MASFQDTCFRVFQERYAPRFAGDGATWNDLDADWRLCAGRHVTWRLPDCQLYSPSYCICMETANWMVRILAFSRNRQIRDRTNWREEEAGCFGFLNSEGLNAISKNCPLLRTLWLEDCVSVDDIGIAHVVINCKRLHALRIENCPNIGKSGMETVAKLLANHRPPAGGRISNQLTRVGTARISSSRSPMRVLQILRCTHFTEPALRNLLSAWGGSLKTLHVAECGPLSDTWLTTIGSYCLSLEDLILWSFDKRKGEDEGQMGGGNINNNENNINNININNNNNPNHNNVQHLGLRQQLAQFWAQFHAQAQAALLQNLQNPLPPPPLPLPMLLLAHGNGRGGEGRGKGFSNSGIESLSGSCTGGKLKRLSLHPCGDVTGEGVAVLARNCSSLQYIDLSEGRWEREGVEGPLYQVGILCRKLTSLCLSSQEGSFSSLSPADVAGLSTSGIVRLSSLSFGRFSLRGGEKEWETIFHTCGNNLLSLRLWKIEYNFGFIGILKAIGASCPNLKELWIDLVEREGIEGEEGVEGEGEGGRVGEGEGGRVGEGEGGREGEGYGERERDREVGISRMGEEEELGVGSSEAISSLGKGCRQLQILRLSGIQDIGDGDLALCIKNLGQALKVLEIVDCSGIGSKSLFSVAENCRLLEYLRIGRQVEILEESLGSILGKCEKLILLSFCDCLGLSDSSLVTSVGKKRGRRLEKLIVTRCWGISENGVYLLMGLGEKAPKLLELNEQKNMDLTAEIYLRAAKYNCTISNLSDPEKGSMAGDVTDPDWRLQELSPAWKIVTVDDL